MAITHRVMTVQACPTRWNGITYRSRLEARWGIFFTTLGIKFEYEPEGFQKSDGERYLPDFFLPYINCFAEVKPEVPDTNTWLLKAQEFVLAGMGQQILYLIGPPACEPYTVMRRVEMPNGNESWISNVSLDIYCKPRRYWVEKRLYEGFPDDEFRGADKFTEEYNEAVSMAQGASYRDGLFLIDGEALQEQISRLRGRL